MKRVVLMPVVTALILAAAITAEVPQMINYQGFLTDANNQPLTENKQMVFSIYDAAQGGNQLWSSGIIAIGVEAGHFSYVIGSDSSLPAECFAEADRWLGIQVLPDNEMAPRTRLSSVPYAYQTLMADTAEVGGGWVVEQQQKAGVTTIHPADATALVFIGSLEPLVGTRLFIQGTDIGLTTDHLWHDDVVVEDVDAILGLYSSPNASYGSGLTLGEIDGGNFVNKWSLIRETSGGPLGGNGLRLTFGNNVDQIVNPTYLRVASDGDIAIGAEDPGGHRLYVASSGGGASGATGRFVNTNGTNGIAIIGNNESGDVTMLLSQHGTGPILRCDTYTDGWHPVFTVENNGRTKVRGVLEVQAIDGTTLIEMGEGLDYAEGFDVSDYSGIEPGAVLVIDSDHPGQLALSNRPYDRAVAGIAAGANGLGSGVRLGAGQFDFDVALAGRVYCNVDASFGAIQPGDLLTTSPTPGHAMKVTNYTQAQGAILGKAMQPMEQGQKGQILVLVTLQ